jgi:deoxyribose-phosphate aldolase
MEGRLMKPADYEVMHSKIKKALSVEPSFRYAQMAMQSLDLTSLNEADTGQTIKRLCQKAKRIDGHHPAAVCVFPQFIEIAKQNLVGTSIKISTVINFPFGDKTNEGEFATAENTFLNVRQAIENGAQEIDIVVAYHHWKEHMNESYARELLTNCREACGEGIVMKVILETAAFEFESEIEAISQMALECGADFIKTSTGKFKDIEFPENLILGLPEFEKVFQSKPSNLHKSNRTDKTPTS